MKTIGLASKLFVVLAFGLTLISLAIAGFFVPSIESDRQKNVDFIDSLQDVHSLESQRFGQHVLNLSAAAQIIASERILGVASASSNKFTRGALLQQGRDSVIRGLTERLKAIRECIAAIEAIHSVPAITKGELSPVPEDSAKELFTHFDERDSKVIQTMRDHVGKIQEVDDEYEEKWRKITEQIREKLNKLSKENSVLNYKISFYMKVALGLQVLAMLSVFVKDLLGS